MLQRTIDMKAGPSVNSKHSYWEGRVCGDMFVICVSCSVSVTRGLNPLTFQKQFSAVSVVTTDKFQWKLGAVHVLSLTQLFKKKTLHLVQSVLTPQPNERLELSIFSLWYNVFRLVTICFFAFVFNIEG